jgi:hypothetical protein
MKEKNIKEYKTLPPINYDLFGDVSNTMKALYSNRIWALHELLHPTSINNDRTIKYLYLKGNTTSIVNPQIIAPGTVGFDLNFNDNAGHVLSQTDPDDKDKWALIYTGVNYIDNGGTEKTGNYYRKIYSVSKELIDSVNDQLNLMRQ